MSSTTVCENVPGEFSTFMFRLIVIILLFATIGLQIFWLITIKNKVEQAQQELETKEQQVICKACDSCKSFINNSLLSPLFKPICNELDCSSCPLPSH